ncbi:unnamed protein product [Zymoseptoria tritici ST99CH_3D1]|nr:unnamed protein product [Zymoseptoria tritici ST99CH_3D1]
MSNRFLAYIVYPKPLTTSQPPFPSLYWPFPVNGPQFVYLYDSELMWRFTLYWTLICVGGVHLVAALYALAIQRRNWKLVGGVVLPLYVVIGAIEALIAGNVVGGLLSAIYVAGYFRMSTWIPLTWGITNALVLITSSFAIQGGL